MLQMVHRDLFGRIANNNTNGNFNVKAVVLAATRMLLSVRPVALTRCWFVTKLLCGTEKLIPINCHDKVFFYVHIPAIHPADNVTKNMIPEKTTGRILKESHFPCPRITTRND